MKYFATSYAILTGDDLLYVNDVPLLFSSKIEAERFAAWNRSFRVIEISHIGPWDEEINPYELLDSIEEFRFEERASKYQGLEDGDR